MALLSRELEWAGRCFEASHREPLELRRRRATAVRVVASNLRFVGAGTTALSSATLGSGSFETSKLSRGRKRAGVCCRAAQKSLYETLGVSPTATEKEIKRAYRGLALKFHPDVNKQPGAQEKFLEIKNAYQTLVDSKSRSKYDAAGSRSARSEDWDPFQWSSTTTTTGRKQSAQQEEFYGLDEFLKDLQSDLQKRSSSRSAQPKSLWEELADIGEEFVEFLEKELNISDEDGERETQTQTTSSQSRTQNSRERSAKSKASTTSGTKAPPRDQASDEQATKIQNDLDDIDDMLAKLKKELGR